MSLKSRRVKDRPTVKRAMKCLRQGRYESAGQQLRYLVRKGRDPDLWQALANVQEILNQPEGLETAREAARLSRTPDNLKRWMRLVQKWGEPEELATAAEAVLQKEPRSTDAYLALIKASLMQKDVERARDMGDRAETACAANHEVQRLRAAIEGRLGHTEKSIRMCRESLADAGFHSRGTGDSRKPRILMVKAVSNTAPKVRLKTGAVLFETGNDIGLHLQQARFPVVSLFAEALEDRPELLDEIPEVDGIYCSITDADKSASELRLASELVRRSALPVVNDPETVLLTRRDLNARRFKEFAGVVFPATIALPVRGNQNPVALVENAMEVHGLEFPVILRSSGLHTGQSMYRVENRRQLARMQITDRVAELYLIEWLDTRDARTGLFPKYRAFRIGNDIVPVHAFMGPEWIVHARNSVPTMRKRPEVLRRIQAYLDDPLNEFTRDQWARVEQVLMALDLEICGIDFAIDAGTGQVVVFEANAAMQLRPPEREGMEFQFEKALANVALVNQFFEARFGSACLPKDPE